MSLKVKLVIIVIGYLAIQCSEPPALTIRYEDREVIDSLYNLEYEAIIDSLNLDCDSMKSQKLSIVTDSILKVRLIEVAKQKKRFQQ